MDNQDSLQYEKAGCFSLLFLCLRFWICDLIRTFKLQTCVK